MTLHRGKIARAPTITLVRPLTRDDLAMLREERGKADAAGTGVIQRLRDPHHRLARLYAAGLRTDEVAARSGFSYNRCVTLQRDPAFRELIAKYREKIDKAFITGIDDYYELATSNMLKAERMVSEKLEEHEEEGTLPPIRDLIAISRDAADRFGYGKRNMNLNVNVDFAAQLEKTIARSKGTLVEADQKTSSPRPQPPTASALVPAYASPSAHPSLPLVRRRA